MKNPRLSIVTVTRNAQHVLERTLRSVEVQDFPSIEHIVVDGASTDDTLEILRQHEREGLRWISEPDSGLYDAMNKGLQMSRGQYVLFLNAADTLSTPTTISQIFSNPEADIYYGDTLVTDALGNVLAPRRLRPPKELSWTSFRMGMLVCHQSFIARRTLCPAYDLRWRFSSDFDWCIRTMKNAQSICNTRIVIAHYALGGISKQNEISGLGERWRIMTQHYGTLVTALCHVPITLRRLLHVVGQLWTETFVKK